MHNSTALMNKKHFPEFEKDFKAREKREAHRPDKIIPFGLWRAWRAA
jgi:hypothetical protein